MFYCSDRYLIVSFINFSSFYFFNCFSICPITSLCPVLIICLYFLFSFRFSLIKLILFLYHCSRADILFTASSFYRTKFYLKFFFSSISFYFYSFTISSLLNKQTITFVLHILISGAELSFSSITHIPVSLFSFAHLATTC